MRALRLAFAFALAAPVALVACSSSSDSNGAGSIHAFSSEYCSLTAHCCTEASEQDPASCSSAIDSFQSVLGLTYDAARGQACLTALRAVKDCNFKGTQSACDGVLGSKSGAAAGTKQPGDDCKSSSECATSADGPVTCSYTFSSGANGGVTYQICQVQAEGVSGGPCDGDLDPSGSPYTQSTSGKPPAVAHFCPIAKGLKCDTTSHTCKVLGDGGAPCTTSTFCKSSTCTGGQCAPVVDVGGSCAMGGVCAEGAYCQSGTCAAKLAAGMPCPTGNECQGFCDSTTKTCTSGGSSSPPLGCFSKGSN
jgi:hypothetical protein